MPGSNNENPVSDNAANLDLYKLKSYITTKAVGTTALEVGKYRLAKYLEEDIEGRMKQKDLNYQELQKVFFIAYKINEFLERPDTYEKSLPDLTQSVFLDRSGMQRLLDESKESELGLALYAEQEMKKLFRLFQDEVLRKVTPPRTLQENKKAGWGYYNIWGSNNLYLVIKDLFEQCQVKLTELEKSKCPNPL